MSLIPFKVSARTALLLGRENVASAKGAIIELVKNAYDADSQISIVYFDNKFGHVKSEVSVVYIDELIRSNIDPDLIKKVYEQQGDIFFLKQDVQLNDKDNFLQACSKLNAIYLIDAGEGMTRSIVEDNWMTIGTNNKLTNAYSKNDRVKAGAKGIGRFALDRLGAECVMTTFFDPSQHQLQPQEDLISGYLWEVHWQDFEAQEKNIGEIGAEFTEIPEGNLLQSLNDINRLFKWDELIPNANEKFGTILKITNLRDNWDDDAVSELYSDLEVLVPPKETEDFKIVVHATSTPYRYGEVLSSVCDDFDYKIVAKADGNQNIKITIYRQEYDAEAIPLQFFDRPLIKQEAKFSRDTFIKGYWESETNFAKLIPGFSAIDSNNLLNEIGPFEFNFYFLKRSFTNADAERFFYRRFASNIRKDWLSKFGGIKLFRDNFRVRPYGEAKDVAFDWLGLGNRKAASPAGVAKEGGGYRVEPENVAGAIKISRLANVNFEDKSSREGLQENHAFQLFKNLIASIIRLLEEDRSLIARELNAFYNERFGHIKNIEAAERLAKAIVEKERENQKNTDTEQDNKNAQPQNDQVLLLAHLNESKNATIEKLEEEQKLLRALASSGIVSASFGHDFSKISQVLETRVDDIIFLIKQKIDESSYAGGNNWDNPFYELNKMRKQDIKVRNWLNLSLGFTRKDKRRRKQLFLQSYFDAFSRDWELTFLERAITFKVVCDYSLEMRVFEIDFDSIFSNLIVNSIEAFRTSNVLPPREIHITCGKGANDIWIEYRDTGPGLSKDIIKPEAIFDPLYTTRRNSKGEETGTGLGMWIVKSVVEENDARLSLLYPEKGFALRISFPIKYERKNAL